MLNGALMLRTFSCMVAALALALVGCNGDDDEGAGGGSSTGGPETSASTGADGSTSTGFAQGSTGSGGDDGCQKVDFLFVIDNSVSMNDEQAALVASFPAFIDTIESTVAAHSDYHIMVADTDAWGRCSTANGWVGETPGSPTCNDYIESTVFDECDRVVGAGVVDPAGQYASNMKCDVYGDNRYIVEGDPDASATFACMAKVGTAGNSSERPMDAIVGAVSTELNEPGGCNEGFLRDDAILVVTFISDDTNYEDTGTPQDWYDAVVAAKGGHPESVVVLGLTPYEGAMAGKHWHDFIGLWGDKGLEASVGLADYSPFFAEAVALVDQTCDEFVPPQ